MNMLVKQVKVDFSSLNKRMFVKHGEQNQTKFLSIKSKTKKSYNPNNPEPDMMLDLLNSICPGWVDEYSISGVGKVNKIDFFNKNLTSSEYPKGTMVEIDGSYHNQRNQVIKDDKIKKDYFRKEGYKIESIPCFAKLEPELFENLLGISFDHSKFFNVIEKYGISNSVKFSGWMCQGSMQPGDRYQTNSFPGVIKFFKDNPRQIESAKIALIVMVLSNMKKLNQGSTLESIIESTISFELAEFFGIIEL